MNNLPLRTLNTALNPALLLALLFILATESNAAVRLAGIFGDNMILQRDRDIRIWGWDDPGKTVTTEFLGKTYSSRASQEGKWMITLAPTAAGGPYEMAIADGMEKTIIRNILVGEVWICAGQSNMVLDFNSPAVKGKYAEEIAASANDAIRQVIVNRTYSSFPAEDCRTSGWRTAGPQTLASFSAAAYFFAKELYSRYHIPIGLVNDCLGGTLCEAWTGEKGLTRLPQFTINGQLLRDTTALRRKMSDARTAFDRWDELLEKTDSARAAENRGSWSATSFDDSQWSMYAAPGYWNRQGHPNTFGSFWFRKEITLPAGWASHDAVLNLGQLDDADITYFNGVEVGKGNNRDLKRRYTIPASVIKAGKNVIAIRIVNYNGTGGMNPDNRMSIHSTGDSVSLNGEWKFHAGASLPVKPNLFDPRNLPSSLYNAMIAPLSDLQFRGVIWYQGEYNARRAFEYQKLFPALIMNWRETFHNNSLPFLFVQLPNFQPVVDHPVENDWAELREAQLMALSLPATGMAVTIDVGDTDLHPAEKKPVGVRLSLLARKMVYGEKKIVARGPLLQRVKIKSHRIVLLFDTGGSPLTTNDQRDLRYFAIAGEDRKFVWAKAVIRKHRIKVSSPQVPHPVAVRYAWSGNPEGCNLFNKSGLPASPFRTDSWPGITVNN